MALKPNLVEAHHNLGLVLRAMGRLAEAAASFDTALALRPGMLETHVSLGLIRRDQTRLDDAAACFERALALRPQHPGAWMNLANIYHLRGDFILSIEAYRQILTVHPTFPDANMNLGAVLKAQGDPVAAEACFRRALALRPDYPAALHGLGGVLAAGGQMGQAIDAYQRAVVLQPDFAEAHASLGAAWQAQGRLDAAETAFRTVVELRPTSAVAHMNLAKTLQSQGRLAAAIAALDRVLSIEPEHGEAADARLCALSYQPEISVEHLLDQHRRWGERQRSYPTPAFAGARDAERRLRIGYVSGDFRRHPVGFFIGPVLASHDQSAAEVFCYSNGDDNDETTARLSKSADHWREIAELDDDAAAALVRADRIDILVDLSGHTPGARLDLFARRSAPVQASWLGYAATTGLAQIDYLLMDRDTAPPEARDWCTEALARLPHGRFCYGPPDAAPTHRSRRRLRGAL